MILELEISLIDLLPVSVDWDYNRFSESRKKRETGKFFAPANLGIITKPATVVDIHGKILLWYLPSLLLPYRVVCSTAHPETLVLADFMARRS